MVDTSWVPVEGAPEQLDQERITDLAMLDEFAHPTRARLVSLLRQPATVAELAARMDVPVTRLYHHIAHLESLGFVHAVATRKVRSVTEKRYRSSARSYRIDRQLVLGLGDEGLLQVVSALFDLAKAELVSAVDNGLDLTDPVETPTTLRLETLRLTRDRQRELLERMGEVLRDYQTPDDTDETFVVLFGAFPSPPPR